MANSEVRSGRVFVSAVSQAADELRRLAMTSEDGTFLGSEEDMIDRLGVSRPTLRQASALVVQENLIKIRRGVGGGYFANTPNSMTVSRIAALYLQSRNAGMDEVIHAMKPIRIEIALLATRNRDPVMLAELQSFLDAEAEYAQGSDYSYRAFLRSEREFGKVLGRLGGNQVLTLFLNTLYDFTALLRREEDVLVNRPERVDAYRELRARMARAILEGDEEIAVVATRRCSDMVSDWMHEDFAGRSFDGVAGSRHSGTDGLGGA
jgi:GntR family transcriptional repressor for pyruvate dehydrogenase complex